jgi:hypothetical protein
VPEGLPNSFRDKVEQANKVLTDVVDTSFGMLRSLLPVHPAPGQVPLSTPAPDELQSTAPWNNVKPGFGMLRRESGFSIRSIKSMASSLPIGGGQAARRAASVADEEKGQQMVNVSRPGSARSVRGRNGESSDDDDDGSSVSDSVEESEEEGEGEEEEGAEAGSTFDARSIRSFESMMSSSKEGKGKSGPSSERKSLSDRLAHMSSLAGLKVRHRSTSTFSKY